jgi:hypothetical protein
MKRYYIILVAVVAWSCNKSFLDTTPTDSYTEETYWTTQDRVVSAINGCYASMLGFSNYKLFLDNISPNSYNQSGQTQLAEGKHDAGNVDWFYTVWNLNYGGIGRTNNLLAHIDAVPMDEALRKRIRGEALFLRALFYADLVNFYGGVPLILDAPNIAEQAKLPRDTREAVVSQIIKDLDNAALALPPSNTGANKGRATKGAALALKARVLLYESSWEEAAKAALEVTKLPYDLFPNYRQLFSVANENNQEVIFDVQYAAPDYTHGLNLTLDLQLNIAPLPDLVNSYLMKDGLPASQSALYDPAKPYENRDPRLMQTIAITGYMFKGVKVPATKYYSTGFGFKKYTTYEDSVTYSADVTNSPLNIILLRFADALLMYAEAQNEFAGPDNSVYTAVNRVRKRAGMPDLPAFLSKDDMRTAIRLERRIELAGEGLHYNDIRRWRTAEVVMNQPAYNSKGNVIQVRSFNKDRDYLWPIATVTFEQNKNLEQNPRYAR